MALRAISTERGVRVEGWPKGEGIGETSLHEDVVVAMWICRRVGVYRLNTLDGVAFQDDGGKVEGRVRCEQILEVAIDLPVRGHVVGEQTDRVGDLIEAVVA